MTMAVGVTNMNAEPMPCTMRLRMRESAPPLRPHNREPTLKMTRPAR